MQSFFLQADEENAIQATVLPFRVDGRIDDD